MQQQSKATGRQRSFRVWKTTLLVSASLLAPLVTGAQAENATTPPVNPVPAAGPAAPVVPHPTPAPVYAGPEAQRGVDDARASLRLPPAPASARNCRAAEPALPLSRDWASWSEEEFDPSAAPRMLADAMALLQGNAKVLRDKPLARRLLEPLAAGNTQTGPRAKRELALVLVDPEAGEPDPARARALLEAALAEREPTAALSLGRMYRDGKLPGASPQDAARFFSIAASFGEPRAGLEFAGLFSNGMVAEPFEGAGQQYLTLALIGAQTAIQQGDCTIVSTVGDLLLGPEGRQDTTAALPWYEFGDQIDDPVSELRLAALFAAGLGVARDRNKALALEEAAAAHGSIEGMTKAAARHLEEGRSLPKGLALARKAAEHQSIPALRLIARYQRGDFTGRADFAAMNATLDRVLALPGAGLIIKADKADALLKGLGGSPDPARAAALYAEIAAAGTPDADFEFGTFLLATGGDRTERDRRLLRAAQAGHPLAMLEVSETLRCEGRPEQAAEAQAWRGRAAESGSAAALRRIAIVEADLGHLDEARSRLERAADLGDRLSMVDLARLAIAEPERAAWIARATAEGADVVEGRLGLARAILSGEIAAGSQTAETLLASIETSGNHWVDFESAKLALSSATADEPAWAPAIRRLVHSARAGNPKAMMLLARLGGTPGAKSAGSAQDLLRAAASSGDPQALAAIKTQPEAAVVLNMLGKKRVCDPAALLQMARLQRDAGKGAQANALLARADALAQERARDLVVLGDAYVSGLATGLPDAEAAQPLLSEAVRRGSQRGAVSLARILAADGTPDGYGQALNLLRGAAFAGEPTAIKTIAALTDEHAGRAADFERGLGVLRDLSDQGNSDAMFAFGSILGNYDDERRADGIAYLERAAAERHVGAMKALAQLYAASLSDNGAARKSTRWTKAAAELGDPEAMFRYALALDIGFGVSQDHAAANTWHERARDRGYLN